ncbi:MAG: hypothetical protein EHM58_08270 [Ignavibacteriae bacterium]|nr:MAG: hypothetical protein EHM58_08270 [Ignavibacteriota bacterium]
MGLFRKLRNIFTKESDIVLGQVAIMNPDESINIYKNFDEAIKALKANPVINRNKIEKLIEAKISFGNQIKSVAGAIRISENGEITEYGSIEDLKKDIK